MDAGHCWLYSPLSGDEPSYNIHCTKRQQGTGTISYLKNKNNPDNAQSMDEKLCYILLVLPGLSLQPWEWAGPHGKGINVCWGQWPQPGKSGTARNTQDRQEPCSHTVWWAQWPQPRTCCDTTGLRVQGHACQVRNSAQKQRSNLSMSKAGHTGQHNDFSPSVQIHWQPHSFSLISLTLKIVFLLAKNNLGVLKKKKSDRQQGLISKM